MQIISPASKNDIDSCFHHAWRLQDQIQAFTAVQYVASRDSVSVICGTYLHNRGQTKDHIESGVRLQGQDVTSLFLNQALEYFQKALYNYYAQYLLARNGYATWARVTNYYASFFSIHCLLCLQGRAVTRMELAGKKIRCYVMPYDLLTHDYIICTHGLKVKGGEHAVPWHRYYEVYDQYSSSRSEYELVHKRIHVTDPLDESIYRNEINYVPFSGFREIIDHAEREQFKSKYDTALSALPTGRSIDDYLSNLYALGTDPDYQYFARVALRILFAADILKQLAAANIPFQSEWMARFRLWQEFASVAFSSPPANFIEALPTVLN